jgi:hypothetical protein
VSHTVRGGTEWTWLKAERNIFDPQPPRPTPMSYTNDVPWPGSSSGSISHLDGSSYFSPSSSTVNVLDHSTLAPNQSSQYASAGSAGAGGTTFRVVSGSELPDARQRRASAHARAPSSPNASTAIYSPSRSKKLTPSGAEDSDASGNPVLRVRPGPIPLTSSSTIVKSTAPGFVRPEEVWKEILKTAYGRDKALVSHPRIVGLMLDSDCRRLL